MSDGPVELESQVILRLPQVPAGMLRDVLRNNPSSLKDRLKIKLEPDMRHGTLYFDNYIMQAKLVDLPCVIESHKTIENKHIYKTADICQMLICSFDDETAADDEAKKKKDLKLEKKYLWPHGLTPPLKNVRKRRFRKTLKKKQYSDQPELEKEVRRLLRTDYEAVQITWEVIDEEEQTDAKSLMQGSKTNEEPTPSGSAANRLAVEHIFGEDLSDSDLEDEMRDAGDESRLSMDSEEEESQSMDDSRASFSQDTKDGSSPPKKSTQYVTSFSGEMFSGDDSSVSSPPPATATSSTGGKSRRGSKPNYNTMSKAELKEQLESLKSQLTEISARCQIQEAELASVENMALRQRLESVVDKLNSDQEDKKAEIVLVQNLLARGGN
jgi:TATA-binding protein-associated factor Taf7